MTDFIQARCPECDRLLEECYEGSRIRTDFIQARCPECNRLLAECCEGSRIRTVCPRCKKMVSGAVIQGKFIGVARTYKPVAKKVTVVNPIIRNF